MKRALLALVLFAAVAGGAHAQTVTPGSSIPIATPSPGDVIFGIHGGTNGGVGGTTSRFAVTQLGSVVQALPVAALSTAGFSANQVIGFNGSVFAPMASVQSIAVGGTNNLVLTGTAAFPQLDLAASPSITGNLTVAGGAFALSNATSNIITYTQNGVGAPTFTTTSVGEKVKLFPNESGSTVDYALGVQTAGVWISLGANTTSPHLYVYGGQTQVFSLDGTGAAVFGSNVQAASVAQGTASYVPPVYTSAGAAVPSTYHGTKYSCTFAAATSCAVTGITAPAAFVDTTYSCPGVDMGASTTFVAFTIGNKTTTGFTIYAGTSNSDTVYGTCWGA